MRKCSDATAASGKRLSIVQDEQDKKCEAKVNSLATKTQKQFDKVASKVDQISRCSEAFSYAKATTNTANSADIHDIKTLAVESVKGEILELQAGMESRLSTIETDVEKLEHTQAGILDKITQQNETRQQGQTPHVHDSTSHVTQESLNFTYIPPSPIHDKKKKPTPKKNETFTKPNKPQLAKTLVIMDSNKKHLKSLWKNCETVFSPTAEQLLPRIPYLLEKHNPELILIHNGTNDIDTQDGATVARTILTIVQKLKSTCPNLKIVVSEIPPRMVNRDNQVQICNEHLHTHFDTMEGITMAQHSNLRTTTWEYFDDDKHLKKDTIKKFASNLKSALRDALNIKLSQKKGSHSKSKTPRKQDNLESLERLTKEFLQKLGIYQGK